MASINDDIKSQFPSEKVKAMLNILHTANYLSNIQVKLLKPFGISPQQYNILRILKGSKQPLKIQTVKERMVEKSPNTTRLMDKLVAKDFLERIPCKDDRRIIHVNITSEGVQLLKDIAPIMQVDFLDNITDREAEQLSNLLDKIR
jgi:MarR family transcriptional regulator, 2-MHQ and catechol-resistance regulon repressor